MLEAAIGYHASDNVGVDRGYRRSVCDLGSLSVAVDSGTLSSRRGGKPNVDFVLSPEIGMRLAEFGFHNAVCQDNC